jgi:hypothetical protein
MLPCKNYRSPPTVTYNPDMDNDASLHEFVQILGRIKELLGEANPVDDDDVDLAKAIERMRQDGNEQDADELAELLTRAEKLQARHVAKE